MATTPPMHSAVHTPPTPLHGARYDSYQPYSTRKSTRYSTQRSQRAAQTPPPQSSDPKLHSPPASTKVTTTGHQTAHTYSPPSSPHHSPRKTSSGSGKTKKSEDSSGMKETSLSFESTSIDLFQEPNISSTLDLQSSNRGANMLPTPAKTPRKKPISAPAIASTARVLFPVQTETVGDAIPTPRKKGRKRRNAGFSLNSSMEDDDNEDKIRIFTDSKEKIPELDPSEDNPFYDNPNHDGPPKEAPRTVSDSIAKKRKLRSTVSGNKEIEEAFKREEGMVYVL